MKTTKNYLPVCFTKYTETRAHSMLDVYEITKGFERTLEVFRISLNTQLFYTLQWTFQFGDL